MSIWTYKQEKIFLVFQSPSLAQKQAFLQNLQKICSAGRVQNAAFTPKINDGRNLHIFLHSVVDKR
jgi:hypothetical protein